MIWLWIPIMIWMVALLIMGLPKVVYKRIQELKGELAKESKLTECTNPKESMYKSMEEGILEMVHFQNLCFMSSIIGLLLMALGTVALCAVLLLR